MELQFGLGTYEHRAKPLAQIQQNCYLEQNPLNSKSLITLLGSYGIDDFATPGNGPLRGGKVVKAVPYVVSGTALFSIDSAGVSTSLGTIPNLDRVSIAGDSNNVMVVTAGDGYVYDGSTVSKITDADFPGADWVEYLDTRFVIGINGTVYLSDSGAPKDWQALQFITAEGSADDIVGGIVEKRELFIGGTDTFEVWATSTAVVPIDRVASGFIEIGLIAKFALTKIDNTIFAVATDFTVRRFEGYTPIVISTPAVSQMIEDLADKSTIYLTGWSEGGHIFIGMTSDEWTTVFDTSTQLWHTRKSATKDYWKPLFILNAFDKYLVADRDSNKLGKLGGSVFADWGDPLILVATVQVVHAQNRRIASSGLELIFQAGVGLTTGQGSNPVVGMRQSFDDGNTWTDERLRFLGKIGKYRQRAYWSRMGQARTRQIEYQISDPVRRSLLYANLDVEVGDR